jgi:DNA-directed RNA polymerase subunit omega
LTKPEGDVTVDRVNNRYSLVVLAAKRAKQLKEGAPPLIETTSTNMLTIALEEIASGKVTYTEAVEPVKASADDIVASEPVVSIEENFLAVTPPPSKAVASEKISADLAAFLPPVDDEADTDEDEADADGETEDEEDADDDESDLADKA